MCDSVLPVSARGYMRFANAHTYSASTRSLLSPFTLLRISGGKHDLSERDDDLPDGCPMSGYCRASASSRRALSSYAAVRCFGDGRVSALSDDSDESVELSVVSACRWPAL